MAHTKQAKKRIRTNDEARIRNKVKSSTMKTYVKRVLLAVDAGDAMLAQKEFQEAQQRIDKCARKNIIHANKAARMKSLLARRIAALSQPAAS